MRITNACTSSGPRGVRKSSGASKGPEEDVGPLPPLRVDLDEARRIITGISQGIRHQSDVSVSAPEVLHIFHLTAVREQEIKNRAVTMELVRGVAATKKQLRVVEQRYETLRQSSSKVSKKVSSLESETRKVAQALSKQKTKR